MQSKISKEMRDEMNKMFLAGTPVKEVLEYFDVKKTIVYNAFYALKAKGYIDGTASNPILVDYKERTPIIVEEPELKRVVHTAEVYRHEHNGVRYIDITEALTRSIECSNIDFGYCQKYFKHRRGLYA